MCSSFQDVPVTAHPSCVGFSPWHHEKCKHKCKSCAVTVKISGWMQGGNSIQGFDVCLTKKSSKGAPTRNYSPHQSG